MPQKYRKRGFSLPEMANWWQNLTCRKRPGEKYCYFYQAIIDARAQRAAPNQ